MGTFSTRAKWRTLSRACCSVLEKCLTPPTLLERRFFATKPSCGLLRLYTAMTKGSERHASRQSDSQRRSWLFPAAANPGVCCGCSFRIVVRSEDTFASLDLPGVRLMRREPHVSHHDPLESLLFPADFSPELALGPPYLG